MSISQHGEQYFTTPELIELRKEDDALADKYRVKYTVTEELIRGGGIMYEGRKVGEIGTRSPDSPVTKEESLDLFFNYYTQSKLISLKFNFLINHLNKLNKWNVIDIENELTRIRDFIKIAESKSRNGNQFENEEREAYIRIKNGSFRNFYFSPDNRAYVRVYTWCVLFYDFLRDKLIQLYKEGQFCKLSPLQQIDFILLVIKERTDSGGISFLDLITHLEETKYLCGFTLAKEILKKLEKNEKILFQDDVYKLTFEGRIFNGYESEQISLDAKNEDDVQYDQRAEENAKRLNFLTGYLAVGTIALAVIEVVKMFVELSKLEYLISLTALYLLGSGLILGIIISLLIIELNKREKR
jgi:hypothetical protein